MEKSKKVFVRFLFILVSLLSINGGLTLIHAGNSVQILLSHDNGKEAEVPHNHQISFVADDDKWIDSDTFYFFSFDHTKHKFLINQEAPSEKYAGSVWQPPKFI
jgi:hypothetical protein